MPGVFGRDRELAVGDAFLAGAAERFAALVIEGEAGVGKTTVWAEVVRCARDSGFRVLSCRPAETEAKFALSALADLLEGVPDSVVEALPDVQRRALEVALLRAEATGDAAQPRTLATAVRTLLGALSGEGPLLVAIDDVQWLDTASAEVLQFSLRRLQGVAAGWLFARRTAVPCRLVPENLVGSDELSRSVIGPVTVAALHHIVKDRLGQTLTRSALVRIHGVTGGNPFYALEIARELIRTDAAMGVSTPVPDSVRDVLARRLRRLPAATRDALLVAAALSDPHISVVDEEALRPAEEDDIVVVDDEGRISFRHPLYASAVYGSASPMRRRHVHMALADQVTDPEERARHLAAVTTEPDVSIAGAIEEGALLARSRGAWASAAELLGQAAALTPAEQADKGRARAISAAEHHIRAGDRWRARALLEDLVAEPMPRALRADALRLLGEVSYNDQNINAAVRLLNEALDHADEARMANTIELGLAYVQAQLWDFPGATPHAHRALERAETAPDHPLLSEALAYCAMFDYLSGQGVDWSKVDRALELEDPDSLLPVPWRPSTVAGLLSLYVGRHAEGRERLRAVWSTAVERGDESDIAFIALWLSWLETRVGDLDAAAALVEEASTLAEATGGHSTDAWTIAQRAYVHALRGEEAETRRDCVEAAALLEQFVHVLASIWLSASLGVLELSLGNPAAAWDACEPLVVGLEVAGIGEPVPAFFLPDALEALVGVGQLDRAQALIEELEERGRTLGREWAIATGARCRALLLAARGEVDGAAGAIDEALAVNETADFPFELGRTLLVGGVIQRRRRQRAKAKESFERAQAIFDGMGARLWAQRAAAEIERLGLRRGSGGELTPSERRVAELVASGMSNREAAAALSVSAKTVEATLARVYRKLGIASRAELGARMTESLQK